MVHNMGAGHIDTQSSRKKNIVSREFCFNTLSLGVAIGSILGFIIFFSRIIAYQYIKYNMFRSLILVFQTVLNKWIILSILVSFLFLIIVFIAKLIWQLFLSNIIEVHIRIENKGSILLAGIVCSIVFFYGGWTINNYFLPHKFHPISLISDLVLLLFTIVLGLVLVRLKCGNVFNVIKNIFNIIKANYIKKTAIVSIISLVILNLFNVIDGKINAPKGPNLIFLSIETTRVDHLSCYGYDRKTSPTIDKLASEGVLFSNMFVQRGLTWPSLTSIMTSLDPVEHGVRDNGWMLPPSMISLAEILQNNRYKCGAFLANAGDAIWRGFDYKRVAEQNDVEITQKAIEWLKNNYKRRIFLWIHYWEPHKPYQPPKPYDRIFDPNYTGMMDGSGKQMDAIALNKIKLNEADLNHIISLYDGSILCVDDLVKKLLTVLKALGIEKNSLIIVTADHGEDLYQHHCYFYHAASIYDSSLHVPFIIKLPNKVPNRRRIDEIVESIDIAPTILDLLSIPIPSYFKGNSLTPLMFSKNRANNFLYAYSEWKDKILSIRTDKYRYIYNPTNYHPKEIEGATETTYPIEKEELYDVMKDPKESINIVSTNRDVAQDLMKKLSDWNNFQSWIDDDGRLKEMEVPVHVRERLRTLGYVQ